jgi:dolichol-phosphate mannosyltransferase
MDTATTTKIAVVIPCYKVTRHVLDVIAAIGPECTRIYAVDDACPEHSGNHIENNCRDPRVSVLRHDKNQGVGGAMITGYQMALVDGMEIVVKIDGDGQMDPALLLDFVAPILVGEADYTKGNRFFDLEEIRVMPKVRLIGNAMLSFMTKLSSGYWDIFDPANGYTAIHASVLRRLPLAKISKSYFFETDMLFRLNTVRAVVVDVPMHAKYADEVSNLKISRIATEFLCKHVRNFCKRIFYNYYLRDMSLASLELPLGVGMLLFGSVFGGYHWIASARSGIAAPFGTVMLASITVLMGLQFVLAFIAHDISSTPRRVLHRRTR